MKIKTEKILGKTFSDARGELRTVPSFDFKKVKRFYHIRNKNTKIIRAFHGHMIEEKYVYVVKGTLLLCLVAIDDKKNPSKKNKVQRYILNNKNAMIVHVPAGFANGFRALENDTHVIFYSTTILEDSQNDDYRFPYDYWGKEIWDEK